MKKEYKLLGGAMKIATGPDADELKLLDLEEESEYLKEKIAKLKRKVDTPKETKDDKPSLNNDDVPYEVRMKHIIQAYKKDQERWAKLAEYAKHLEGEVIRLKGILIDNGYTDSGASEDWSPDKEIAELKKKIKKLEDKIENEYPKKKKSILNMKKVMCSQASYIVKLQDLLDKNGITYITPNPIKKIKQEDIDAIDENDVR